SPERGQATLEVRKLFPQLVAGRTFQPVHNLANCQRRRERSEQVNVVRHHNQVKHLTVKLLDVFGEQFGQAHANIPRQDWTPVFRTPDEVVVDVVGCVSGLFAHSNLIISREGKGGKRHSPPGSSPVSPGAIPMESLAMPMTGVSTATRATMKFTTTGECLRTLSDMMAMTISSSMMVRLCREPSTVVAGPTTISMTPATIR